MGVRCLDIYKELYTLKTVLCLLFKTVVMKEENAILVLLENITKMYLHPQKELNH